MNTLRILIIFFTFLTTSASYGQDGSDIMYFKTDRVDSFLFGQYIQFDFHDNSFSSRSIDTITIIIDGNPIKFIEVRKDNGYQNWFYRQYLQSVDIIDGLTIRVPKFRLDSITTTSFGVTMYVEYYNQSNNLLVDKTRQLKYWFNKKDIVEVLVKSKQL